MNPWVLRQNNSHLQARVTTQIEMIIDMEIADFDQHIENMLRHALAGLLKIPPQSVRIRSKEEGSVRITLELPAAEGRELVEKFKRREVEIKVFLPLFKVLNIQQPNRGDVLELGPSEGQSLSIKKLGNQSGLVKWFSNSKGYGFLKPEAGGDDVFVHHTAVISAGFRTLNQGERVSFEVVEGPKGLMARNVIRQEGENRQEIDGQEKAGRAVVEEKKKGQARALSLADGDDE